MRSVCLIAVTFGYGSPARTVCSSGTLFYLLNVSLVFSQPAKMLPGFSSFYFF